MVSDKINIYMPIELKNRDFNSRLLLSLKLLEKDNFNIFFGYKGHVNYFALRYGCGIYFSLSAYKNQEKFISNLKKKSNSIFLLDEESLITYKDDFFLRTKTSKLIYDLCDKIFVTGKSGFNRMSNYTKKKKILLTGNPRLDLLKDKYKKVYKEEIDTIKKKYKNFILFCTTFSYINHYNDENYINTLKKQKYLKNKTDRKLLLQDLDCQKKSQKLMIDFICNYAKKLKNLNIVIRVHPSENPKIYNDLAKKFKNVFCDNSFSVHPWILVSNKMLNHYCTTTIEGLTANKKVISIKPYYNSKIEINDFFEITNVAKNEDEIFKEINSSKKNNFKRVKYFAYNALGKTDSISKIVENSIQIKKKFPKTKSDFKIRSYIIKNFFNRIKNNLNFKHNSYINHKIGNISLKDIDNFMEHFPSIKKKILAEKICKNFFYLTNKK